MNMLESINSRLNHAIPGGIYTQWYEVIHCTILDDVSYDSIHCPFLIGFVFQLTRW